MDKIEKFQKQYPKYNHFQDYVVVGASYSGNIKLVEAMDNLTSDNIYEVCIIAAAWGNQPLLLDFLFSNYTIGQLDDDERLWAFRGAMMGNNIELAYKFFVNTQKEIFADEILYAAAFNNNVNIIDSIQYNK